MLTIALTTAITVLVVAYLYRKWTFWSRQGQVQDVLAMFGVMNKPFHEMDVLAIKRSKKKVVGIYEFLQPALLVADAEVAKQVMVTDFHNFTHRKILQREEGHFSHSLFTARDDLWKRLRSTISPSFSPLKLKTLQPLMEESIASLVKRFKEESGQQDGVVDILHYYCLFAMDIILSCAFGTYADVMKNPDSEIARHGKNFLSRDISWETMFVITFPDIAIKLLNMNAIPHGPAGFFAQLTASVVKQRTHDASMSKPDWIHFMMNSKNEADGKLTFARCPETKVPLDYYTAQVVMGAKDVRVKVAVR
ncbi:Cytochrome P450 6k1 [Halotydeus destructor]|nr:Cytochrome P450 6k1 [Halotydeus destructor]